tara:strand:+ start:1031 stop:1246 length:216 start_codon:yes stop_codon:yes gene_type:complete
MKVIFHSAANSDNAAVKKYIEAVKAGKDSRPLHIFENPLDEEATKETLKRFDKQKRLIDEARKKSIENQIY